MMKNTGADKPYYDRIDARKIYGKRFFDSLPKREKRRLEKEVEKMYRKFDEAIKEKFHRRIT